MSTPIGIRAAYATSKDDACTDATCAPKDAKNPPTLQLIRAWAFEIAAQGSAVIPPAPPKGNRRSGSEERVEGPHPLVIPSYPENRGTATMSLTDGLSNLVTCI